MRCTQKERTDTSQRFRIFITLENGARVQFNYIILSDINWVFHKNGKQLSFKSHNRAHD